jgi:hypothetical protein
MKPCPDAALKTNVQKAVYIIQAISHVSETLLDAFLQNPMALSERQRRHLVATRRDIDRA